MLRDFVLGMEGRRDASVTISHETRACQYQLFEMDGDRQLERECQPFYRFSFTELTDTHPMCGIYASGRLTTLVTMGIMVGTILVIMVTISLTVVTSEYLRLCTMFYVR
nr:protein m156.5 [Murid betaherpesvirus 1]